MSINLSRVSYCRLSYVAIGLYWLQLLVAPFYQDTRPFTPMSLTIISTVIGLVVSLFWLISIYATKRGWLWVTALFSWFLVGLVNTIAVLWQEMLNTDCPALLLALGIGSTLYLYLYSFLGLAMPILNHFGLLAPEPPVEEESAV